MVWVQEILRRRYLLWLMTCRNVKLRYRNSALGFFWSLLGPLFLIVIYSAFLRVMKFKMDLPVLVVGIVGWQFLATCLGDSLGAIVGNSNLVTKAAFPRSILPLSMVAGNIFNFLLSMLVVGVYLLVVQADFGSPVWFLVALGAQCILCLGVALLVGATNVFFRDTEHLMSVIMLAWFFMTPVIYPIELVMANEMLPEWAKVAYFANPMAGIISAYRASLLSMEVASAPLMALSFGMCFVVLFVGMFVFRRGEPRFGDVL